MVQTLAFFIYFGIAALIFSEVEGVTYVDGIYYMVVTTLTIGFGDITPHTATFKILTFPFTVIGIALLALIVTSIVRLLSDRVRRRKRESTKRLEERASQRRRIHAGYNSSHSGPIEDLPRLKRSLPLHEELRRLREDEWRYERRSHLIRATKGLIAFLAFWFFGALVFHLVEVQLSKC